MKLKLKTKDAAGDVYEEAFEVENSDEGLNLLCPWCASSIDFERVDPACANGHLAYTIIDVDIVEKVNNSY